ncbi:MAG: hypothetical protein WD845_00035, partial [Pirellulales bacterium]
AGASVDPKTIGAEADVDDEGAEANPVADDGETPAAAQAFSGAASPAFGGSAAATLANNPKTNAARIKQRRMAGLLGVREVSP